MTTPCTNDVQALSQLTDTQTICVTIIVIAALALIGVYVYCITRD